MAVLEKIIRNIAAAGAIAVGALTGSAYAQEAPQVDIPAAVEEEPSIEEGKNEESKENESLEGTIYALNHLDVKTHPVEFRDITDEVRQHADYFVAGPKDFDKAVQVIDSLHKSGLYERCQGAYAILPKAIRDSNGEKKSLSRRWTKGKWKIIDYIFRDNKEYLFMVVDKENEKFLLIDPKFNSLLGVDENAGFMHIDRGRGYFSPGHAWLAKACKNPVIRTVTGKKEDKSKKVESISMTLIDIPKNELTVFKAKPGELISSRWYHSGKYSTNIESRLDHASISPMPNNVFHISFGNKEYRVSQGKKTFHNYSYTDGCLFNYSTKKIIMEGRFNLKGFSNDSNILAVFKRGSYYRVDVEKNEEKLLYFKHNTRYAFEFSPDGNWVACTTGEFASFRPTKGNYSVDVYNNETGQRFNIHHYGYPNESIRSISDDGTLVLSRATFAYKDGNYECTKTSSGKPLDRLRITGNKKKTEVKK